MVVEKTIVDQVMVDKVDLVEEAVQQTFQVLQADKVTYQAHLLHKEMVVVMLPVVPVVHSEEAEELQLQDKMVMQVVVVVKD